MAQGVRSSLSCGSGSELLSNKRIELSDANSPPPRSQQKGSRRGMSGSGSTIVVMGDDDIPEFVQQDDTLFKAPTRLITRKAGEWYAPTLYRA